MDLSAPTPLLAGLSPRRFMKLHWQKKPLLVRGAVPGMQPLVGRKDLFELAGRDDVESRLVAQKEGQWSLRRGPLPRRAIPPVTREGWTLLVQGLDLLEEQAHALLRQFAFVPHARLDDLMVSYATEGGGVGPHFDSYDVFLLQVQGRRRWRIGRQKDLTLRDDVPLKVLADFQPEQEFVLEPGDMLYLPPLWAHDGIAEGECQTYSIGFRSPARGELARDLLQRLSEDAEDAIGDDRYVDPKQAATDTPGAIPGDLVDFAKDALRAALKEPLAVERALGEILTEPKPNVWFEAREVQGPIQAVTLDPRTRMMYDAKHVFINGESYRASGKDAALMRALADRRRLPGAALQRASEDARTLLHAWCESGWAHAGERSEP